MKAEVKVGVWVERGAWRTEREAFKAPSSEVFDALFFRVRAISSVEYKKKLRRREKGLFLLSYLALHRLSCLTYLHHLLSILETFTRKDGFDSEDFVRVGCSASSKLPPCCHNDEPEAGCPFQLSRRTFIEDFPHEYGFGFVLIFSHHSIRFQYKRRSK